MTGSLRLLIACAAFALAHGTGAASAATLLVRFDEGATAAERTAALASVGGVQEQVLPRLGVAVVSVDGPAGGALAELNGDPAVDYAERDGAVHATLATDDPIISSWSWQLKNARIPEAWDVTTGGPVVVAVLDTGVEPLHPELEGRVLPGWDFVGGDASPSDDNGRGTAVAGIVAAEAGNGVGIAGVCWECRILPVKVLGASGSGTWSDVAKGIVWATDHGATVVNLSLGGMSPPSVVADAVAYAHARDVLLVASAGNSDTSAYSHPAAYPAVLAVGAVDRHDVRYSFSNGHGWGSNKGSWVDVAAAGCTSTTWPGDSFSPAGTYLYGFCGTSAAAPFVSGVAALLRSLDPELAAGQVRAALEGTAGPSTDFAHGRIDAADALAAALLLDGSAYVRPNVSVSLRASRRTVPRGRAVVFAVSVRARAADATGSVVRLRLPVRLGFVRAETGRAACSGRRTVVCRLPRVSAGGTVKVSVVARARRPGRGWVQSSVAWGADGYAADNAARLLVRMTG